ncbi:13045_t:CDS:2, partial [Funneliformis geosporum]
AEFEDEDNIILQTVLIQRSNTIFKPLNILFDLICPHPVFLSQGNKPQICVELQLAWLTLEECKKIHKVFEDLGGLKNIIVAVDRTHIFMKNISNKDPEVYFTRKKCYAIHCQGIVNDKGIFTSFDIGWLASVHNA